MGHRVRRSLFCQGPLHVWTVMHQCTGARATMTSTPVSDPLSLRANHCRKAPSLTARPLPGSLLAGSVGHQGRLQWVARRRHPRPSGGAECGRQEQGRGRVLPATGARGPGAAHHPSRAQLKPAASGGASTPGLAAAWLCVRGSAHSVVNAVTSITPVHRGTDKLVVRLKPRGQVCVTC